MLFKILIGDFGHKPGTDFEKHLIVREIPRRHLIGVELTGTKLGIEIVMKVHPSLVPDRP